MSELAADPQVLYPITVAWSGEHAAFGDRRRDGRVDFLAAAFILPVAAFGLESLVRRS